MAKDNMATRGAPKPKPKPKPRQEKSKWEFKASDCIEFYSIQPRTFYQRMSSDMCPENIKIKTGFYNLKLMNDYFVSHFFDEEEGETTLLQEKAGGREMKDFQQRVIDEKIELDEKLVKLKWFLGGSTVVSSLPEEEQARLRIQVLVMTIYSDTLGARIKEFI